MPIGIFKRHTDKVKRFFDDRAAKRKIHAQEKERARIKEANIEAFKSWFHFKPELLTEKRYQLECLLTMQLLAKAVRVQESYYEESPNSPLYKREYDEASSKYMTAHRCVKRYHAGLAEIIPHWQNFRDHPEKVLEKLPKPSPEPASVSATPETLGTARIDCSQCGQELPRLARFCRRCGHWLQQETIVAA